MSTLDAEDIRLIADAVREARNPEDHEIRISDTKPWMLNYFNRKHVFMWLPSTSLTMNFEDFGSGVVPAQVWINIGFPQGMRITTTGQSSLTSIKVRATDEVIP